MISIKSNNTRIALSYIIIPLGSTFLLGGSELQAQTTCCVNQYLTVSQAIEIAHPYYPPSNAIDNSLSTTWHYNGINAWIVVGLGSDRIIRSVDIALYRGNLRQSTFDIKVWDDFAKQYKTVYSGTSSGTTSGLERYDFADVKGRYVGVVFRGNTENSYASIHGP